MQYSDNKFKWIALLNRKVPPHRLLNAIGHISLSMHQICNNENAGKVHRYSSADGSSFATLSHWPFVVLQADNSSQIRKLRKACEEAGIHSQAFVDSMLAASAEQQLANTLQADPESVEYFALLMFGEYEDLRPLTKKFSVYKSSFSEVN
jgi:hypothetical protein